MRKLQALFEEQGQSPWVDDLKRAWLRSGFFARLVDAGIRGATDNPTIFEHALLGSDDYDDELRGLAPSHSPEDVYWELAIHDVAWALEIMRPVYDESDGADGFVSLELAPALADDTEASVAAALGFFDRIGLPNLFVKVPATSAGVPAIRQLVAAGRNVNVTLIFGLRRYEAVLEAYLAGLEAHDGDLSAIASVASFFVSRVDTEVDRRLEDIGTSEALALRGKTASAQAKVAYEIFRDRCRGPRWDALASRGARVQRPLWASTSTKNPSYPDLLYIENLIGPDTVTTMPEKTIAAFLDHGTIARTIDVDVDVDAAHRTLDRLEAVGVDLGDVAVTLEREGVAAFQASYEKVLRAIDDKTHLVR